MGFGHGSGAASGLGRKGLPRMEPGPFSFPAVQNPGALSGFSLIYQGRYKSLPVETGPRFLTLVRYVERNAQRAGLAKKAEDWPWSSAHACLRGNAKPKKLLGPWPVPEPDGYRQWLSRSQRKEEVEKIREAIKKSRPYGSEKWRRKAVAQFGLENPLRNSGRLRNGSRHHFPPHGGLATGRSPACSNGW